MAAEHPCFGRLPEEEKKFLLDKSLSLQKAGMNLKEADMSAAKIYQEKLLDDLHNVYHQLGVEGYETPITSLKNKDNAKEVRGDQKGLQDEGGQRQGVQGKGGENLQQPEEKGAEAGDAKLLMSQQLDEVLNNITSPKTQDNATKGEVSRDQKESVGVKESPEGNQGSADQKEKVTPQEGAGSTAPSLTTQTNADAQPESTTKEPTGDDKKTPISQAENKGDTGQAQEKEKGLVGKRVEAVFAGGRVSGKVIEDKGNRVKIQADDGTKYPVLKLDLLKEGETVSDHYENSFEGKLDKKAQALKDKLNPKSTRGVRKAGIGSDEIIDGAVAIIKAAYHAGEDIAGAIDKAIQFLKDKWSASFGDVPEADFRDMANDIVRDEKIKDAINKFPVEESEIRDKLKSKFGFDDDKITSLINEAKGITPKSEADYPKPIRDMRAFALRDPEFTGDTYNDRRIVQGVRNSMIQQAKNIVTTLPKKFNDAALQENVYHHMEDSSVPITADEKEFRDKYVRPMQEALEGLYHKIIKYNPDFAEALDNQLREKIGFVPREAKGKRGTMERIIEKEGGGKSGTNTTGGSKLMTGSGHLKSRLYKAYQDEDGRHVIYVRGERVFKSTPDGLKEIGSYDGKDTFTDKDGVQHTIGDATVKEIETQTPTEYYKTPLANFLNAFVELKQVDLANKFIESSKSGWEEAGVMFDLKKGRIPEGYETTQLENFRGYAFPIKIAGELDRLAYINKRDPFGALTAANQFLRNMVVFGTGIPHWANEIDLWLREGGVSRIAHPIRLIKSGMRAAHALIAQSPEYFEAMEKGASLMTPDTHNYTKFLLESTQARLQSKPGLVNYIQKKFGSSNPLKLLSNFSHTSAMASHDFLMLTAMFEHMDRGESMQEAILSVNKYIPTYDIPSGSNKITQAASKFFRNPNITMFSAYHYGLFNSYASMAKDFTKAAKNMDAKELAKSIDKIAMTAIMHAFLYPIFDAVANALFTTEEDKKKGKKATVRRAGAEKLFQDTEDFAKHQKTIGQLIYGIATPAQMTELIPELAFNINLNLYSGFGHSIYVGSDVTKHPLDAAEDAGKFALDKVSPLEKLDEITSGKKSFEDWVQEQVNIKKTTSDPQKQLDFLRYEQGDILAKVRKLVKEGKADKAKEVFEQYGDDLRAAAQKLKEEKKKEKEGDK